MRNWPKIVVVRIADNVTLATPGGGTSWSYRDLEVPSVADIGPYLESLRAHMKTLTRSTNFAWKPVFYWSFDGASWTGPLDIETAVTADGSGISAEYTTATSFGLHLRFALGYRATTGTAVETGTVSCVIVCKTLS